jgi:pilus assembly protein Flp/PilA
MLKAFWRNDSGATAIEYGLVLSVLSLAIFAGIARMQEGISYLFSEPTEAIGSTLN